MPSVILAGTTTGTALSLTSDTSGELQIRTNNGATTALTLTTGGAATFTAGTVSAPAITTTGDTNTGIFFPAADTIAFTEGGVEAMRIDSSGNLGIGTNSPTQRLDVVSNASTAIGLVVRNRTGNDFANLSFVTNDGATIQTGIVNALVGTNGAAMLFNRKPDGGAATEAMRINASGDVGIGTSNPSGAAGRNLTIYNSSGQARISFKNSITGDTSADGFQIGIDGDAMAIVEQRENLPLAFSTNATERMRITSSGDLCVGTTSQIGPGKISVSQSNASQAALGCNHTLGAGQSFIAFANAANNALIGTITNNGNTATAYNTTSDYRLKENVAAMTGALATVQQLKPVTYKWKADGSDGQGFIAHELQAVVPDAVVGEKDAVDAEGKPVYQGIDTSFLVATLTSAIQELKAIVDAQAARIAALESK
jgi:hypothetical protein